MRECNPELVEALNKLIILRHLKQTLYRDNNAFLIFKKMYEYGLLEYDKLSLINELLTGIIRNLRRSSYTEPSIRSSIGFISRRESPHPHVDFIALDLRGNLWVLEMKL